MERNGCGLAICLITTPSANTTIGTIFSTHFGDAFLAKRVENLRKIYPKGHHITLLKTSTVSSTNAALSPSLMLSSLGPLLFYPKTEPKLFIFNVGFRNTNLPYHFLCYTLCSINHNLSRVCLIFLIK